MPAEVLAETGSLLQLKDVTQFLTQVVPSGGKPTGEVAIYLEGTVMHVRPPELYDDVLDDLPIKGSSEAVRRIYGAGFRVVLLSCKPEKYRSTMEGWLKRHGIPFHELRMNVPRYRVTIGDRMLNFDGNWNGILGRALLYQTWWEVLRDGPMTFEQAVADELRLMRSILVDRNRKYGPENMLKAGIIGALNRAKEDKMARLSRYYTRMAFREQCREMGMPQELIDKYAPEIEDFTDEKIEDTHVDAANYVGPISLMLRHGTWATPMGEELAPSLNADEQEEAS